ncbi:MAG TPA: MFS transporter [Kofleriaceae bacterium]|nr:MFS transporter [Kofleriaceae bacterium]
MRLSRPAAFALQASIILFFLAGSSAPTPLYAVYQAAWGFSPITVTIIFGIYALAVLVTLLVTGALSDHLGRRPVLLAATVLQAITMLVFATAHGVGALVVARVLQGIATGAAASAVGAGLLDLDRARGTVANAVVPLLGTATGSLAGGLLVQYLPAPTQLVYYVLAAIFAVQAIAVLWMPETVAPRPGALASMRPQFRLPPALRPHLLIAAPALLAAWALAGFYGSLGPAMVRRIAGSSSLALGGLALFVLAASGALTVLALHRRPARTMSTFGTAALAIGVAITLVATTTSSLAIFFVGAVLAGAGFGAGFQGAIRSVLPLARPHERAGVLSVLYVIAYLSMGLPAVLGGLRAVHGGGIVATAREYGLAVMALAAMALIGLLLRRPATSAVAAPVLEPAAPAKL